VVVVVEEEEGHGEVSRRVLVSHSNMQPYGRYHYYYYDDDDYYYSPQEGVECS